jgi:mannose-6-phosphate isomerase-like protein (cupin superfamily)
MDRALIAPTAWSFRDNSHDITLPNVGKHCSCIDDDRPLAVAAGERAGSEARSDRRVVGATERSDAVGGKRGWSEDIVGDRDFTARYIAMAPGEKTKTQFYADDRVVWIVQSGELRVAIEGQQPFVAKKGFLVQVPYRVPYSMETVGSAPSLRFELTVARAAPLYPLAETPTPLAGKKYVKVSFTGRGGYDDLNKPYLDFEKNIVTAGGRAGPFVKDDKTWVNLIRGPGQPAPPPTNLGHFHVDYSEFWFVLEGRVDYLIEGQPLFTAEQGDIVYAPQGRWHRASSSGAGMATRVAINPRPDGMHNYQAPQ